MNFPMDIGMHLPPQIGRSDLQIVEDAITLVITTIDEEKGNVKPGEFRKDGFIADGSFGGFDKTPLLGLHHGRAQTVIADTLKGIKEDLNAFSEACHKAKKLIKDADANAGDSLLAKQKAVSQIAAGSTGANTETAYDDARNGRTTEDTDDTDEDAK